LISHRESVNHARGKRLDTRGSCRTFMGLTTPLPQGQGPRTWVQGPKSRTFDFAVIYHATNTKSFWGSGCFSILCINAILLMHCIGCTYNYNNVI